MPDGDIFDFALRGRWRKVSRAFLGRQELSYKLACISEALQQATSGMTAKAVGAAVEMLEATLKPHEQGVLQFHEAPESPTHSFQTQLNHALADCGGGKSIALVKEVAASVFAKAQNTPVLDIEKTFAHELTRRLLRGRCLDLAQDQLISAGVTTVEGYEAWFREEFQQLYPQLRAMMEKFVASHGASVPKKLTPNPATAVNSVDYLAQPLTILLRADESP